MQCQIYVCGGPARYKYGARGPPHFLSLNFQLFSNALLLDVAMNSDARKMSGRTRKIAFQNVGP